MNISEERMTAQVSVFTEVISSCVNEPVHGLTLREEGQVELWEWPNELSAGVILQLSTNSVNSISAVAHSSPRNAVRLSFVHSTGEDKLPFVILRRQ